jgi:succinoglycan biosynthesis transport protein ExoP
MMADQSLASFPVSAVAADDDARLDIRQLFSSFQRRQTLFLIVFAVLASLIIGKVLTTPPSYTAVASVLVDERAPGILRANPDGPATGAPLDTGRVDTQVEILRSRPAADRIVDLFNLQKDPEFNASLRPQGPMAKVKGWIVGRLHHGRAAQARSGDQIDRQGAPDTLMDHLKVTRVGVTYLLNLAVTANDPVKAKQIANAFADGYLSSQISAKVLANKTINDSLVPRLETLRGQVEAAETAVEQYKIQHNLLSASGQTLTEQEVATLDQQLAMAKAEQVEIEARAATAKAQLSKGSTGEDVGEALNSPVIQQLRQQRALASQKVAEMATRYGDRLPAMVSARRDLADVDSQIHAEIQRIISNLDAQAQVAREKTGSIAGSVAHSRGDLVGNSRASVRLNELERNLDSYRSLYETLLNRYKESNTEQGLEQAEAHIVTPAQTPESPSAPKKGLGVALGLLVGLLGGAVTVIGVEALDTTLSTADKLSRATGVPCLASLPTLRSTLSKIAARSPPAEPLEYLVGEPRSSFAEAFRNLRTSLVSYGLGRSSFVLAITSALPDEGKSTSAMCLGRTFASSGLSVVVVDCDLKRRAATQALARPVKTSAVELSGGDRQLEDALLRDETSGAWVLPLSAAQPPQVDVFSSQAMGGLIGVLRSRFDLVILDTGSVLAAADTRALAAEADGALLLVRWRKTPIKAVQAALALLSSANVAVLGTALSFVDLKQQAKTGYGDAEYYFNKYKSQYQ